MSLQKIRRLLTILLQMNPMSLQMATSKGRELISPRTLCSGVRGRHLQQQQHSHTAYHSICTHGIYLHCMYIHTHYVCVTYCMCGNFHGTKLSRLHNFEDFRGFYFRGCGPNQFIILQFKMFELESLIRGFMFNMYRGRLAKERYFIALRNH